MRNIKLFLILIFFVSTSSASDSMQRFLKNCAYGVLIGAAAGVVSMSVQDQPSQHTKDIAKGASLGLYAGIIYSYYDLTYSSEASIASGFSHENKSGRAIESEVRKKNENEVESAWAVPLLALGRDELGIRVLLTF